MIGVRATVPASAAALPNAFIIVGVALLIVGGHFVNAALPADEARPLVMATHLYALLLLGGLLWLAAGLGRAILRRVGLDSGSGLESLVFSVGLGLAAISWMVIGVGLAGFLTVPVVLALTMALAVSARHDLSAIGREIPASLRAGLDLRRSLRQQNRALSLLVPIAEIFFAILLLKALAPPTANDPLTYHLEGPRRFLELGRVVPLYDVEQANMPFAVNMLYLLGLAFSSDELAGLLHLAFVGLTMAATFAFGRRFFNERVGYIAATAVASTTMTAIFGTTPNVDFGLAFFDFLGVYGFARWLQTRQLSWLMVAGTFVGAALATKYLGAITAVSLGTYLLYDVLRTRQRLGWGGIARTLLAFGLPAAIVAAPWYAKNLVWFGDPVWPFLANNPNDFQMYISPYTRFEGGFWSQLLLPLRLYTEGSVEFRGMHPPLQLLALPALIFVPRGGVVYGLIALATVQFVAWSQGAHVLRYLTQGLPEVCLVAAYALDRMPTMPRIGVPAQLVAQVLIVVGLVLPTGVTAGITLAGQPLPQLVGLESREAFVERTVAGGRAVNYLNEHADDVHGVLMIGDGRGFYLQTPHWEDVSYESFRALALAPDAASAHDFLAERGISHVMVNTRDLAYFVPIDTEQRLRTWWRRFEATRAGYLVPEIAYGDVTLYRVVNADEAARSSAAVVSQMVTVPTRYGPDDPRLVLDGGGTSP